MAEHAARGVRCKRDLLSVQHAETLDRELAVGPLLFGVRLQRRFQRRAMMSETIASVQEDAPMDDDANSPAFRSLGANAAALTMDSMQSQADY